MKLLIASLLSLSLAIAESVTVTVLTTKRAFEDDFSAEKSKKILVNTFDLGNTYTGTVNCLGDCTCSLFLKGGDLIHCGSPRNPWTPDICHLMINPLKLFTFLDKGGETSKRGCRLDTEEAAIPSTMMKFLVPKPTSYSYGPKHEMDFHFQALVQCKRKGICRVRLNANEHFHECSGEVGSAKKVQVTIHQDMNDPREITCEVVTSASPVRRDSRDSGASESTGSSFVDEKKVSHIEIGDTVIHAIYPQQSKKTFFGLW